MRNTRRPSVEITGFLISIGLIMISILVGFVKDDCLYFEVDVDPKQAAPVTIDPIEETAEATDQSAAMQL